LSAAANHCRAEDLLAVRAFDTLTARAVAPLTKLLTWFEPYWGAFDRLLAVKGPSWVEERHEAREQSLMKNLQLRKLETWPLPGTDSESVLLEIRPKT
jgi:16S rRNA (guanine527-N7)-methyltransferase